MMLAATDSVTIVLALILNTMFFLVVQGVAIRLMHPRRLLLLSALLLTLSTAFFVVLVDLVVGYEDGVMALVSFWLLLFIGSFGVGGLYTFLGPATADRSATAHFLVYLQHSERPASLSQLHAAFDSSTFIEKRLVECTQAGMVQQDREMVALTNRGRRLARIFAWLQRIYDLERLPGFSVSFKDRRS